MIWVTYEEFNGYEWDMRLTSCTTSEYEALKKRSDVIIIKAEKINIVSY